MRASLASITMFAAAAIGSVAAQAAMPSIRTGSGNEVPACVTPERLMAFTKRVNRNLDPTFERIAGLYEIVGRAYEVRWDYAFFQMLVETNYLSFRRADGSPQTVAPSQYNLAGLGAVGDGNIGETFPDLTVGVQAHVEHILIYSGMKIANPVAERTRKVISWGVLDGWLSGFDRPITFRDLALRWSPFSTSYSDNLEGVANRFFEANCPGMTAATARPSPPVRTASAARSGQLASAWVGRADSDGRLTPGAAGAGPASTRIPAPRNVSPDEARAALAIVDGGPPKPREATRPPTRPAVRTEAAAPRADVAPSTRPAPPPAVPSAGVQVASVAPDMPMQPKTSLTRPQPEPKPEKSEDDKVRELVAGRTVELKADMGAVIPVQFRSNGTVVGEAPSLAFFLGAPRDRGKWWVEGGRLCKRWRVWLDAKTMCLKLNQEGRIVHWVADDGRSGTATIIN